MYLRRQLKPSIILWFCWKYVVFFAVYSALIVFAYSALNFKFIAIPFLPVGTIGTAVAFYVGFKNNASYERLWEARKIWGTIANLSRAFGSLVMTLGENSTAETTALHRRLIRRQIAWFNSLRLQLRERIAHKHKDRIAPEVALIKTVFGPEYNKETQRDYLSNALIPADLNKVLDSYNPSLRILEMQIADLQVTARQHPQSAKLCDALTDIVVDCIKEQGASERLKNFPFPRQYAYFSGVFVWIFLLLLPFGLLDELVKGAAGLVWSVIPFSTLISWMFLTMEQVGDSSEDPFELGLNDVPLTTICRNTEIELLQMLGETNLPERILPVADILL